MPVCRAEPADAFIRSKWFERLSEGDTRAHKSPTAGASMIYLS